MLKDIFRRFILLKHGFLVLLLLVAGVSFLLGFWWREQSGPSPSTRIPELSEKEKLWREQGLVFDDGVYFVGSDIAPGVYRTTGTGTSLYGCSWQRLSGFGAENDNIIAKYREDKGMPTIATIGVSDKGFKTQGCGAWYSEEIPVLDDPSSFGDGAFMVGADIQPGVYKSDVEIGCYWERLSGFGRKQYSGRLLGLDAELIASSNDPVAEILPSDKGFISYNCGQWTKHSF